MKSRFFGVFRVRRRKADSSPPVYTPRHASDEFAVYAAPHRGRHRWVADAIDATQEIPLVRGHLSPEEICEFAGGRWQS